MVLNGLMTRVADQVWFSVPYLERAGGNKHHRHFNLDEEHFGVLGANGIDIQWAYQLHTAEIIPERLPTAIPGSFIQNLIGCATRRPER